MHVFYNLLGCITSCLILIQRKHRRFNNLVVVKMRTIIIMKMESSSINLLQSQHICRSALRNINNFLTCFAVYIRAWHFSLVLVLFNNIGGRTRRKLELLSRQFLTWKSLNRYDVARASSFAYEIAWHIGCRQVAAIQTSGDFLTFCLRHSRIDSMFPSMTLLLAVPLNETAVVSCPISISLGSAQSIHTIKR